MPRNRAFERSSWALKSACAPAGVLNKPRMPRQRPSVCFRSGRIEGNYFKWCLALTVGHHARGVMCCVLPSTTLIFGPVLPDWT